MRFAFLTPEFPSEKRAGGGVGNYVLKMALALKRQGHDPEVFVVAAEGGVLDYLGVRVNRVARPRRLVTRAYLKASSLALGSPLASHYVAARRLAQALEARHAEVPFDVVQSSNYHLTGLCVAPRAGRRHLIRLSTSRLLFDEAYGRKVSWAQRIIEALDVRTMRRADAVYAPSRFLADYFNRRYGLEVGVLRPPYELGFDPAETLPFPLPPRYLIHFGRLGERKGTKALAVALEKAWTAEPALTMVWVGDMEQALWCECQRRWGEQGEQVVWLGPLPSEQLYAAIGRADASVLPSKVDNLPNTVIESLALGVPVIGTRGASIDELVVDGESGALVPLDDAEALAESLVRCWRREVPWLGAGFTPPAVLADMRPEVAVARLLELARPHGVQPSPCRAEVLTQGR